MSVPISRCTPQSAHLSGQSLDDPVFTGRKRAHIVAVNKVDDALLSHFHKKVRMVSRLIRHTRTPPAPRSSSDQLISASEKGVKESTTVGWPFERSRCSMSSLKF